MNMHAVPTSCNTICNTKTAHEMPSQQSYQIVSPKVAKKFQKMPKSEFWQKNSPHFSNLVKNSPKLLQMGGKIAKNCSLFLAKNCHIWSLCIFNRILVKLQGFGFLHTPTDSTTKSKIDVLFAMSAWLNDRLNPWVLSSLATCAFVNVST